MVGGVVVATLVVVVVLPSVVVAAPLVVVVVPLPAWDVNKDNNNTSKIVFLKVDISFSL